MSLPEYPAHEAEFLPQLDIYPPTWERKSTVLLRALLALPQVIAGGILSFVVLIPLAVSWLSALILGRLPDWSVRFLAGYLAYLTRVNAYLCLVVDDYPPFEWNPQNYPVSISLRPGTLNRLAVLLRIILVIPATILASVLVVGWIILGFFSWLTVLLIDRMPRPLFGMTAAMLRYVFRTQAYYLMLTSAYPKYLFGDHALIPPEQAMPEFQPHYSYAATPFPEQQQYSETTPLLLSHGAREVLIAVIVLGLFGYIGAIIGIDAAISSASLNTDGTSDQNQVVAVFKAYYAALAANNTDGACEQLTPELQISITNQARVTNCISAYNLIIQQDSTADQAAWKANATNNYDAKSVKIDGTQAVLTQSLTYPKTGGGTTTINQPFTFRNENGKWLIDEFPQSPQ